MPTNRISTKEKAAILKTVQTKSVLETARIHRCGTTTVSRIKAEFEKSSKK